MDRFDIDNAGGYLIELAEQALKKKLIQRFRDNQLGVTPFQWVILYRLWKQDRQTQAELSLKTFKDYPAMTRVLDGLEKEGLIRRESNKTDRRSNIICLTEKGREMESILPSIVEEHLSSAFNGISREDFDIMKNCLKRICKNLSD